MASPVSLGHVHMNEVRIDRTRPKPEYLRKVGSWYLARDHGSSRLAPCNANSAQHGPEDSEPRDNEPLFPQNITSRGWHARLHKVRQAEKRHARTGR